MTISNSAAAICLRALDFLAQKGGVTNIDDPRTDEEVVFSRHYDDTRQLLLRNYVWNFAKGRKLINRDANNTPEFDYSDAYPLPNDFVRLLSIGDNEDLANIDYDLAGGFLLLNNGGAASIKLRYIKDVTDVSKFDAGFRYLFTLYLSLAVSYKFTVKATSLERIQNLIDTYEAKLVSIDGQERPPKRIQRSKLKDARRRIGASTSASPWV